MRFPVSRQSSDAERIESEPAATAPASRSRFGGERFLLPLLLVVYLGFACLHAFVVPIGQNGRQNTPDEGAHLSFVRSVASFHLPTHDRPAPYPGSTGANGYEWHQPPLYYALAAPFLAIGGQHGVRLFSILCGFAGLLLIYRGGRLLFPADPVVALLAVGMAALTPTHVAITSSIDNDVLLEVCFSAALCLLIGALQKGLTLRSAAWLGLSIGAAILTKATGLLLLPILGFAVLLMAVSGTARQDLLQRCAVTLGIVVLLSGWWFVRNQALYGQLLPLRLFAADFGHTALAAPMAEALGGWGAYFVRACCWTFFSFWAVYGRKPFDLANGIQRFLPTEIYVLMGIACLCAAAGFTRLHFQRKALFTTAQLQGLWVCFLTIALVGLSYIAFISHYFQMQGRYLFPAMLPISVVFALGFRGIFPERYKNAASALMLGVWGAVALAYLPFILP
jgi:hypothetical protein